MSFMNVHDGCKLVSESQDELEAKMESELLIVLVEWQEKTSKICRACGTKTHVPKALGSIFECLHRSNIPSHPIG